MNAPNFGQGAPRNLLGPCRCPGHLVPTNTHICWQLPIFPHLFSRAISEGKPVFPVEKLSPDPSPNRAFGQKHQVHISFCYAMKKRVEKKPQNTQNRPKKGQGHPKQRAKKGPPPQKGPWAAWFFGEWGRVLGPFVLVGPFFRALFFGPCFFCFGFSWEPVLSWKYRPREGPKTKGPKEGPTTPPPSFIIIKGPKKAPPPPPKNEKNWKKKPPTPPSPPTEKGKKGPWTKRPPKKTRKAPKKEGSKARRAREAANPTGETRKSTLPLHNQLHNFN